MSVLHRPNFKRTCSTALMAVLALGISACGEPTEEADVNDTPEHAASMTDSPLTAETMAWAAAFMAEREGQPIDTNRMVTEPSGLSHDQMFHLLAEPSIAARGLEIMADFMKPEGSLYFDAIYGGYHGQQNIRNWLVPTMQEISYIAFEPRAESIFLDDGEGGTSIDEWQMVANIEGKSIPMSRGVSVRKYRDGWIESGVDIYDTMAFRLPPPPEMAPPEGADPAAVLPPPPPLDWEVFTAPAEEIVLSDAAAAWAKNRQALRAAGDAPDLNEELTGLSSEDLYHLIHHPETGWDFHLQADMMHPTESVYIDPIFGEFKGQVQIRGWMTDIMGKVGNIAFDPLGPTLFDGSTSIQEWLQVAVQPDGTRVPMTRGVSIRKFKDGWVTYSADYFDAATIMDPAVQVAGSTMTVEDIMKYRGAPAAP
ncbi:MAG: hypothetical protein O2910_04250 [Proteobacteria bacterium]|nr:hypothetical protein [Pseudomonadota bacterium]